MDNKITIIEGPTPSFEPVTQDWVVSLDEASSPYDIMATDLRTMNGRGLIERCYQTWHEQDTMYLHFRNSSGMEQKVKIIAAQNVETDEGEKLILWVRANKDELNIPN